MPQNFRKSLLHLSLRACAVAAVSLPTLFLPVAAQDAIMAPFPDPSTCPIQGGISNVIVEDIITGASFQTEFIPTLSAATAAVFGDTTMEVHTHFRFSTSDMTLRAWSFPVPVGSPKLTPDNTNFDAIAIAKVVVSIDKMYVTCAQRPTIGLYGPIASSTPIFGPLVGLPHGFSFSFDPTNTTNINNIYNLAVTDGGANTVVGYVASGIITPATTTATIAGAPSIQSIYRQLSLDGSGSKTDNGPLAYKWTSAGTGVAILDPTMPQTRIQIGGEQGIYPVTLTVTSATGQTSTATANIQFVGR